MKIIRQRNVPGFHMQDEWEGILEWLDCACNYCGSTEDITKDHIIPTSRGGSNDPENLQPLCRLCNSRKCDKPDTAFVLYKKLRENCNELMALREFMLPMLDQLEASVRSYSNRSPGTASRNS